MYSRMHTEEKYHMSKVEDKLAYCILVSKENRPQKWKEEVKEVDGLETQFISKRNIKKERIGRTEAKAKENDSKYFVCIRGKTKPENWKGFLNIRQISKHESFENEFNLMSGWVCQLLYSKHILIESSRLQMRWCSYYTHFTDEEVEAWRDPVGSARSHWQQGVQPFWQVAHQRPQALTGAYEVSTKQDVSLPAESPEDSAWFPEVGRSVTQSFPLSPTPHCLFHVHCQDW